MTNSNFEKMIAAWLDGRISESDSESLQQQLRESSEARETFYKYSQLDATLREVADADCDNLNKENEKDLTRGVAGSFSRPVANVSRSNPLRILLGLAGVIIVALTVRLYTQHENAKHQVITVSRAVDHSVSEPPIAKITGLSGSLVLTGDRGQVLRELSLGNKLHGGTIEGVAPDSWFELEFNDGSTVMIDGASMLTFSEFGQKELHLKRGSLSAKVVPQPDGKPMLIHTRSVVLKVLGTQFKVDTELDSTSLYVSEGRVQVKRLSDGRTIEVPANHRIVTSSDGEMTASPIPEFVHDWKSQLHLGPSDLNGKWLPPKGDKPALLKAIPFVPQGNKTIMLHLAGLSVKRADNAPVVVQPGSRFIVRGRLQVPAKLLFGIQVARKNGDFAGMFLARQLVNIEDGNSDFEAVFHLDGFGLDPIVWHRKDELPSKPGDLVLTSVWTFTHTGKPTGLEIAEIELVPPVSQ